MYLRCFLISRSKLIANTWSECDRTNLTCYLSYAPIFLPGLYYTISLTAAIVNKVKNKHDSHVIASFIACFFFSCFVNLNVISIGSVKFCLLLNFYFIHVRRSCGNKTRLSYWTLFFSRFIFIFSCENIRINPA